MPKLSKKIVVDLKRNVVIVDGFEIPWFLSADGVGVNDLGAHGAIPSVDLRILAKTVEVIPDGACEAGPPGDQ